MERILAIQAMAALLAFVAAWHWVMYRRSRGRTWSPLWGAFTATAVATLFVVAGALGYRLEGGVPSRSPVPGRVRCCGQKYGSASAWR